MVLLAGEASRKTAAHDRNEDPLNQSIAAALPLSSFSEEPPLNPISANGLRLPPAEPATRPSLPVAANATLAAPAVLKRSNKVSVMLSLTNGERVPVESFDDAEAAKNHARELTRRLAATTEWELVGERFIRPDAVVSVDLEKASK
jgi:hypothetical protein